MKELSLREVQLSALEILSIIAKICDTEGFTYFLAYGTLIGAVRHHGFIPWDDDIDIWMPRVDYERLLDYLETHQNDLNQLAVFNQKTCKDYPYMITRISDTRYWLDVNNEKNYGIGTFIDIYVLDGMGIDKDYALKIAKTAKRYSSFFFQSTRRKFQMGLTKSIKRKILKYPVYCYAKFKGKKYFVNKLHTLSNQYSYSESKYVGSITWCVNEAREIMDKSWFCGSLKCKFEDYEFAIPIGYDKILKQIYGDYMQLPPEKDRIPHHLYTAYKK